jgi:peroxiredoxin
MLNNTLMRARQHYNRVSAPMRYFSTTKVQVGDRFPSAVVALVKFDEGEGFVNEIIDVNEYFENKSIVLIGYPGAFTPTCMSQHIP